MGHESGVIEITEPKIARGYGSAGNDEDGMLSGAGASSTNIYGSQIRLDTMAMGATSTGTK